MLLIGDSKHRDSIAIELLTQIYLDNGGVITLCESIYRVPKSMSWLVGKGVDYSSWDQHGAKYKYSASYLEIGDGSYVTNKKDFEGMDD
jgi:hypothetical protein